MKTAMFWLKNFMVTFSFMMIALVSQAQVIVNLGDSAAWQGYINGYYGVPGQTAVVYQNQLGSWADVATALFIARVTHTSPERIIALRQAQAPWATIAQEVNLPPNILYLPPVDHTIVVRQGPPYGKAWGYWKKHGNRILLSDAQFENRAVLLGTSRYYRIPVQEEVTFVQQGTPIVTVVQVRNGHRHGHHEDGNDQGRGHEDGKHGEHGNGHGHHED